MRRLTVLFWLASISLIAILVYVVDLSQVARSASLIGWGFLPVLSIRIGLLYIDGHSWRCLIDKESRPSFHGAALQRWIGESVSAMLPFATIGGELARVRIVALSGIGGAKAFASIIMDGVVALFSQFLFLCLGLTLFVRAATETKSLDQTILIGSTALLLTLIMTGMMIRKGALGRLAAMLKGDLANERIHWLTEAMGSVDQQIGAIAENRNACAQALFWRMVGWLLGALEIWLILRLLGHPISIAEALILDAVTAAVRTAFFFIPGGLGVQEGALLLVGAALGIDAEAMLVTVVIKRAREVFFGVPGLIAWELAEAKSKRQSARND